MDNDIIAETFERQATAISSLQRTEVIRKVRKVAQVINKNGGRVIFSGMGKSGDIAKKMESTFSSIGVPSYFLHPGEALHGDIGAVGSNDVVIVLSNSGNTDETVEFVSSLEYIGPAKIAITGNSSSDLADAADYHIDTGVESEGSVVELIPMASATVTLVIGDAIANELMSMRDFDRDDFAQYHPAGTIGKRLLLKVSDVMYDDVPPTAPDDSLAKTTYKMSRGGKGIATVVDEDNRLLGVITDGDIRRLIESEPNFHELTASEVMTENPISVTPDTSAINALDTLENNSITQLVVVDESNHFQGVVHIHAIVQEGLR